MPVGRNVWIAAVLGGCSGDGGDDPDDDDDPSDHTFVAPTIDVGIIGFSFECAGDVDIQIHTVVVSGDEPASVELGLITTGAGMEVIDEVHPLSLVDTETWQVTLEPADGRYRPGADSGLTCEELCSTMASRVAVLKDAAGTLVWCEVRGGDGEGVVNGDYDEDASDRWNELGLDALSCNVRER